MNSESLDFLKRILETPSPSGYERPVQDLVRQTSEQNYRIQALMLGIVHSAPFQQRRGEAVTK